MMHSVVLFAATLVRRMVVVPLSGAVGLMLDRSSLSILSGRIFGLLLTAMLNVMNFRSAARSRAATPAGFRRNDQSRQQKNHVSPRNQTLCSHFQFYSQKLQSLLNQIIEKLTKQNVNLKAVKKSNQWLEFIKLSRRFKYQAGLDKLACFAWWRLTSVIGIAVWCYHFILVVHTLPVWYCAFPFVCSCIRLPVKGVSGTKLASL